MNQGTSIGETISSGGETDRNIVEVDNSSFNDIEEKVFVKKDDRIFSP